MCRSIVGRAHRGWALRGIGALATGLVLAVSGCGSDDGADQSGTTENSEVEPDDDVGDDDAAEPSDGESGQPDETEEADDTDGSQEPDETDGTREPDETDDSSGADDAGNPDEADDAESAEEGDTSAYCDRLLVVGADLMRAATIFENGFEDENELEAAAAQAGDLAPTLREVAVIAPAEIADTWEFVADAGEELAGIELVDAQSAAEMKDLANEIAEESQLLIAHGTSMCG